MKACTSNQACTDNRITCQMMIAGCGIRTALAESARRKPPKAKEPPIRSSANTIALSHATAMN